MVSPVHKTSKEAIVGCGMREKPEREIDERLREGMSKGSKQALLVALVKKSREERGRERKIRERSGHLVGLGRR